MRKNQHFLIAFQRRPPISEKSLNSKKHEKLHSLNLNLKSIRNYNGNNILKYKNR